MNRLLPALLALATLPATAQIDPTFGIDSTYTWPGLGFGDAPAINDLLVHPDGRIWLIIEDNNKAIVHGLDGDGLLDAGFATAGIYQRAGTALQAYQRAMLAPAIARCTSWAL
ncbi:MAG: hypothetical protein IPO90_13150 [Flavobacteriales bacterium]|nr:hypothetical protein [Flavobacteriales bacterium]